MHRVLVINGSYRDDGITDQTVAVMVQVLQSAGAGVEVVLLREYPIEFCLNCRECTQRPGDKPAECVQHDGMKALISKIEEADAYILAAPTNFGSVTAIFKRFMERLIVYAYWPWDMNAPEFRKKDIAKKKALLVSSCAAPGIMGRWLYGTHKQLRMSAKVIGAKVVGSIFTGLVATQPHPVLPERVQAKASRMALRLIN